MKLAGHWIGYYEYGNGYTLPNFGERVEIEVEFVGEFSEFTGTLIRETGELKVDLQAKIEGSSMDDTISFNKIYAKTPRLIDEHSSEVVIEEGEMTIGHVGYIDRINQAMYGDWQIIEELVNEEGYREEYVSQGIWMLRKTED